MASSIQYPYEYDPVKRRLAKTYTKQKIIQTVIISVIIPLAFFSTIVSLGASEAVRGFSLYLSETWHVPIYLSLLFGLLLLITMPFSFYFSYVFEHKYSLSKQKVSEWFEDFLKTQGLLYLVLIPAATGLHFIWSNFPSYWWIIASSSFFVVLLFITTIFPVLLVPFLWKTEEFREEEHNRRLIEIVKKAGIHAVDRIVVVKESEKSKKVNAGIAGLGKTRRIFIFDNLVNNFSPKEIDVVFAHEMGHHANKDIIKGIVFSTLLSFPVFFIISIIIIPIANGVGVQSLSVITAFPIFATLFILIQICIRPIAMAYSRMRERLADQFALDALGDPEAQISAFKRLADIDLEDDSPHPFVEAWLYSHPSISRRIKHCQSWKTGS